MNSPYYGMVGAYGCSFSPTRRISKRQYRLTCRKIGLHIPLIDSPCHSHPGMTRRHEAGGLWLDKERFFGLFS